MTVSSVPLVRIIDDEETVRNSERFILKIVGLESEVFESAEEFLARGDFSRPGCLILDIRMGGMSGLELQKKLLDRGCDLPVLFLSGHGTVQSAVLALKRGAADFLEKPVRPEKLQLIVQRLIEDNLRARACRLQKSERRALFDTLTDREKMVLRQVAQGALNKQIAIDLGIAEQTVKIHRANALHKLRIRTAVDAHAFLLSIDERPQEQP